MDFFTCCQTRNIIKEILTKKFAANLNVKEFAVLAKLQSTRLKKDISGGNLWEVKIATCILSLTAVQKLNHS